MSQSAAAVLAQVMPIVLVALCLEGGRLHPNLRRSRAFGRIWVTGIVTSLFSTGIAIVGTQTDLPLSAAVILDAFSAVAGMAAVVFLIGAVATAQAAAEDETKPVRTSRWQLLRDLMRGRRG